VRGNAVIVLGRAAAADPRGCALGIRQFEESGDSSSLLPTDTRRDLLMRELNQSAGEQTKSTPHAPEATASGIHAAAGRLRKQLAATPSPGNPHTVGAIFREVIENVAGSRRWQHALATIAARSGFSPSLLSLSLHALVRPLRQADELARLVK